MLNRDSSKKKENNRISRRFIFSPFSIPTMADDGEDLESICSNNGVPAHIFSGMLTAGWTIATLATGFKDASEFDDETALQDLGITDSLTRLERAAIKVVWTQCSKIFKDSQSSGSSQPRAEPTSPPPASTISTSEGGWHEAFPPKLGHSTVVDMKKKFQKHYPSEILTPDSLPSNRLLALVHQTISKGSWKWIPWKHRLTLSREEDWQISRSAKYPKIEGLQLHSLLLDEPPTMDVSNFGLHTLRVMFDTFNIAVAMCEGAHLASLKSYSSKFISHLTTRHDAESGLRPPSMVEAQHADQKIQQLIAELVVEKSWSLDQALHEVTHIRADLAVLLQPRPKIVKPQQWVADRQNPQKGKSYEKGYGKKGKDKGKNKDGKKGKGKNTWVTEVQVNGVWKPLCLKYQLGQCNYPDCKYLHQCAFPRPDGTACGAKHSASEHISVPH